MDWLYDKINRVPDISDDHIAEMRHIEAVLKMPNSVMYRRIQGIEKLDPRDVSFLWNAEPVGGEFTFHDLNRSVVITQHHSSVFFKPSLAEVYAWIRFYMPEEWRRVMYFCLREPTRIGASTDFMCECELMGGKKLVDGKPIVFANGSIGHYLVEAV